MENKCLLARDIVRDTFGDVPGDICQQLLSRGRLTIGEITEALDIPISAVRTGLLVCVQHNILSFHEVVNDPSFLELPPDELKSKVKTYYEVDIENILLRLRLPRFIETVRTDLGDGDAAIFEQIVTNGRMTPVLAVSEVHQAMYVNVLAQNAGIVDEVYGDKALRRAFTRLAEYRFITVLPKQPPVSVEEERDSRKSSGSKRSQKRRKVDIMPNTAVDSYVEDGDRHSELGGTFSYFSGAEAGVYWCVNMFQIHLKYRTMKMVEYVLNRVDGAAAKILHQMLIMTNKYVVDVTEPLSTSVELGRVYHELNENNVQLSLSQEKFRSYIEVLYNDDIIVRHAGSPLDPSSRYRVNFQELAMQIQNRTIENIVLTRFGKISLRIFRMLLMKKHLEEKVIAEMAIIPEKESRKLLYQMLRAGVVHLQEIPRSAEHTATSTFFLWTVRPEEVCKRLIDDFYKIILNLRQRLFLEDVDSENLMSKDEAEKVEQRIDRLSGSMMKIDELVMMLRDFWRPPPPSDDEDK